MPTPLPHKDDTAPELLTDKTLQVFWQLMRPPLVLPSPDGMELQPCLFVKERLLRMAFLILAQPRPAYCVTFTGGEATRHPFLSDIVHYLLSTRRRVAVVLETDGSQEEAYFVNLLRHLPKATLKVVLTVTPATADLRHVLRLTALVAEGQQWAHVRLLADPEHQAESQRCHNTLTGLRGHVPFTLDIPLPSAPSLQQWREKALQAFATANATGPAAEPFVLARGENACPAQAQNELDSPLPSGTRFCCVGTHLLTIAADGHYRAGRCAVQPFSRFPLWKEDRHALEALAHPLPCHAKNCPTVDGSRPTLFPVKQKAEAFCAAHAGRVRQWAREAAPLAGPDGAPDAEDRLRLLLRRLRPATGTPLDQWQLPGMPRPELLDTRMPDICRLYEALEDPASKDIFLRLLACLDTGNAAYLAASAYPCGEHPAMPLWPEDRKYLEDGYGFCRALRFDNESWEGLREAEHRIRFYQPKLLLRLSRPEEVLDILAFLRDNFPLANGKGYHISLGQHGPLPSDCWCYARPEQEARRWIAPTPDVAAKLPVISVIVPTHNNADTLQRCLDSALIQCGPDSGLPVELIVVDDASTDSTPDILAAYVRRHPGIVRVVRLPENQGPGPARNTGMDMALGRYMAFIDSDDMLAEHFLEQALDIMEREQADIVAFDMLTHNKDKITIWGVEPGIWAGEDSLRQFLLKKAGCYAGYGRLYRTSFLRDFGITYGHTMTHQDMFFSTQAFYHSRKTVVLDRPGYYCYKRQNSHSLSPREEDVVPAHLDFIDFFTAFFQAHGLSLESEMYVACVRRIYGWDREKFFRGVQQAQKAGRLRELLTDERAFALGRCRPLVDAILTDAALLYAYRNKVEPKVHPDEYDWKALAARPQPAGTYTAYGDAAEPAGPAPVLSVIVPNYNKAPYLRNCLESIFAQTMRDFELIIIDDHSTDESWDILLEYADIHPCIRLFRMDENCLQGTCRNIGIDLSRGEYIIFVDSDDKCEAKFFEVAVAAMREETSQCVFFAIRDVALDGTVQGGHEAKPFQGGGVAACTAYWSDYFPWGPCAKIFDAQFLREHEEVRFPEGVFHEDVHFMVHCLSACALVRSYDSYVYERILSENSSSRYSYMRYVDVKSLCVYLSMAFDVYKNKLTTSSYHKTSKGLVWSIREWLLPVLAAYYFMSGEIALWMREYDSIHDNPFFLSGLVSITSQLFTDGWIGNGVLVNYPQHVQADYVPSVSTQPLLSIIIPVYNQEHNIERCLKSVLGQSLHAQEVLVVDDASTDATLTVLRAWARKDARVRVLAMEHNQGQGAARNRAITLAVGKYVTFVDSDDYVFGEFFLHGVATLEHEREVDVVHFSYVQDVDGKRSTVQTIGQKITGSDAIRKYLEKNSQLGYAVWSKIMRLCFLLKNNVTFSDYLYEDVIFLLRMFSHAHSVLCLPEYAYCHVKTPNENSAGCPTGSLAKHLQGMFHQYYHMEKFISNERPDCYGSLYSYEKRDFENVHKAYILPWLATFYNAATSPITDEQISRLQQSPTFLRVLLEDYAATWAANTGFKPLLLTEDLDQTTKRKEPADYLIPVPCHADDNRDILLSIIIPAFRVGTTLPRCLDSVLQQDQDLAQVEIILVEDGSDTDNTYTICEHYAHRYPVIRFFHTPWNSGLGMVRNLAMRLARGRYVTFLDSDDWLAPHFLHNILPHLQLRSEWDVARLSFCKWDDCIHKVLGYEIMPNGYVVDGTEALRLYINGTYSIFAAWSGIYKRDFLLENNILFGLNYYEDMIFLLKAYNEARFVKFFDILESYNLWKSNSPSITRSVHRSRQHFLGTIDALYNTYTYLKNIELKDGIDIKKWMEHFTCNQHKENILGHIFSSFKLEVASPLTTTILNRIIACPEYIHAMLMDYSILSISEINCK